MLKPLEPSGVPFVALSGASKFYGSFAALKGADLALMPGQVHMLLGENGAGKSTLVSLLIGANRLDEGNRYLHGQPCPDLSPDMARAAGLNAVLQDFSLAPSLTVAENFALGREQTRFGLLSKAKMVKSALDTMQKLGITLDPDARVDTLTRAEQQLLEIARALGGKPGALILDEPTAMLSHNESERLFDAVVRLRAAGWAILYISHRMEEIRQLGDVVTILRDGRLTGHYRLADVSNDRMIAEMVGRPMESFYPKIPHRPAEDALEVVALASGSKLRDGNLTLRFGEIVGLGGLVGCGKAELARAVFGLEPITNGVVLLDGNVIKVSSPAAMLARGLIYLPQDRRGEALALNRSIGDNIVIEALAKREYARAGWLRGGRLQQLVRNLIDKLKISPADPFKPVQELSGGNQQKVVLARALSLPRRIYIFDEPTAGVDVATRLDFYLQLQDLCSGGAAILLITSDLQELIHLSHRIIVMHDGRCIATLDGPDMTEERVVSHAFSGRHEGALQ